MDFVIREMTKCMGRAFPPGGAGIARCYLILCCPLTLTLAAFSDSPIFTVTIRLLNSAVYWALDNEFLDRAIRIY